MFIFKGVLLYKQPKYVQAFTALYSISIAELSLPRDRKKYITVLNSVLILFLYCPMKTFPRKKVPKNPV